MSDKVREALEKQVSLLSKRSVKAVDEDLLPITRAMCEVARLLESNRPVPVGPGAEIELTGE